jgi:excinuclease UvrABC helicase subunit UvrB
MRLDQLVGEDFEAQRLEQRCNFLISKCSRGATGVCNGHRELFAFSRVTAPLGDTPLFEFIQTTQRLPMNPISPVPQIGGMYKGDHRCK